MRQFALRTLVGLILFHAATVFGQPETTETLIRGDVDHGFLVAPDFKFTEVDGEFANLAGAYGGWVIQRRLLLGGGVYTLTNGKEPVGMTYGGGVVEYFVNPTSLINLSLRGLVGGGTATVGGPFRGLLGFDRGRGFPFDLRGVDLPAGLPGLGAGSLEDVLERFGSAFPGDFSRRDFTRSTTFFVAEPEANVIVNISERFRLSVGGGYRFIGGADRLNDRLDGFTASAALKMSFF
ncbi:MAG TPA: hypothetical protein VLK65_20560 [Vicinamibacteria bacterium]|nr:hypothetical protein [Vicinamibacteria bacterium]